MRQPVILWKLAPGYNLSQVAILAYIWFEGWVLACSADRQNTNGELFNSSILHQSHSHISRSPNRLLFFCSFQYCSPT